jgi:hypothetical protein
VGLKAAQEAGLAEGQDAREAARTPQWTHLETRTNWLQLEKSEEDKNTKLEVSFI